MVAVLPSAPQSTYPVPINNTVFPDVIVLAWETIVVAVPPIATSLPEFEDTDTVVNVVVARVPDALLQTMSTAVLRRSSALSRHP